jgi:TonB family protein
VEPLDRKWTCAEIPGTEEHEAAGKELEAEAERIRNVGAQRDTVPVAEVRSVEHTGVEPRLVYRAPEPPFLQEARAGGRQGTVELRFVIDVDGRVKNVRVEKGVGARLDEKTVEWVRQWVYRPAMKYARPVPVEFRANIDVGRQP